MTFKVHEGVKIDGIALTNNGGTLTWNGSAVGSNAGISISSNANNRVLTGDGSNAVGETNLTFDGTNLQIVGSSRGLISEKFYLGATDTSFIERDSTVNIGYRADGVHRFWTYNGSWLERVQITDAGLDVTGAITSTNFITGTRLRTGDGTDGYFYSDTAGRTAFTGGEFYIQDGVSAYYNYATQQYHGATSGDNHYFRGNALTGDNWGITAAGVITATGAAITGALTIDYTGNATNDAGLRVFNDNNDWGIYIDKDGSGTYGLKIAADGAYPFQIVNSSQVEKFRVDSDGDVILAGTVDGVDIAARDAVLTSTTTTAGAALPKAGGTMTGGLAITATGNAIAISSGSPQIYFNDTSGEDDFYIHINSNRFYVLADRDESGNYESPHPLELNASNNVGYAFGHRLFTEAYHPNADTLTTARTINGVSFNGSANITVVDSTKLPLAGGTLTGKLTFNGGLDGQAIMLSGATNFDTLRQIGFYSLYNVSTGSTNPPPFNYGAMISTNSNASGGMGFQLAHERTGAGTYIRGMNDSGDTWYDWDEIWTSGTDGSGSGLDADLLDGLEGDFYFKSQTNNNGGWSQSNRNFSVRSGGAAAGLHMEESDGTFAFQLYGDSGSYGFLDGEWANWDIQKAVNGAFSVDEGSGLKRVLNEANWTSYATATNISNLGINANLLDGLDLHTGRNNEVNKVVRTDSNGYIHAGWINTTSGARTTQAITRVYASDDDYLRYYTLANFGSQIASHVNYNSLQNKPSLSGYATESYVGTAISNLVDSSPAALNTLNELAAAIGDDASFSTTITNSIATKAPLASPSITGTATINQLKIGGASNGFFYSDTAGRTAFNSGDFYIQNSVGNYYNYATNQYIGDSSGDNIYFRGNVLSGTGWSINGVGKFVTRDIQPEAGYHLQRSNHHSGHLEGSYNNIGANGPKSNPIYTIGSSYNPTDAALSNMYGIGFCSTAHAGISFTGMSNWGMYVAADGDARVWLDGSAGVVSSTGEHYVGTSRVFHDTYHPNADTLTTARTINGVSFNGSANITIVDSTKLPLVTGVTAMHNTQGTQNSANTVLRTQVNGYSMLGWINTTSGATSSTLQRVYCSEDGYIRYQTPANFGVSISPHVNYNTIANTPTIPTNNNQLTNGAGYTTNTGTLTATNDRIYITDTRSAARAPSYYDDRFVQADFTQSTNLGVSGGDTWSAVLTVSPWASYDVSHRQQQLVFAGTNLYRRTASSESAWGSTYTLWDSGNSAQFTGALNTKLSGIAVGANNYVLPYAISESATANTIVKRQGNGYIFGNYINMTANDVTSGVTKIMVETGNDNYMRHGDAGSVRTFINVENGATAANLRTSVASTIANNIVLTQRGRFSTGTSGQNNNSGSYAYDWGFQNAGTWTSPYPDLIIGYHTGLRLGAHKNYEGTRFYNDAPKHGTPTMIFSVGNGDDHIRATSNIYAYTSDRRLKENFRPIENAVDKVKSLGGYIFDWRKDMMAKYEFEPDQVKDDAGVIAQDVLKVLPAAVQRAPFDYDAFQPGQSKSGEEFMTVQYEKIVPLLIQAIKEQQEQIDELKQKLEN